MIVPVELVLPVIPLTAGVFDTQVLKHVMLAGPIVKLVLILLVLELTRRAAGWILALIASLAVLYPIFGM